MLPPQQQVKDWTLEVDQQTAAGSWPTAGDSWAGQLEQQQQQYGGPQYDGMPAGLMMMTAVPVPSYPPPFYPQLPGVPAQPYLAAPEFYPGQAPEYGYPHQPAAANVSVFNPSAQVYIPPAPADSHAHSYKAPPPVAAQPQTKPFPPSSAAKQFPSSSSYEQQPGPDPGLMLALSKPPNPLSLRRPGDQRQPVSKLQERLNQNRQSQERDKLPSNSSSNNSSSNSAASKFPNSRFQRPAPAPAPPKPPSMVEMQSGSLKKGAVAAPPPGKGSGLLVLGSEAVEESYLAAQLGLAVQTVPCPRLETFQAKAASLNPSRDWLVLLHGLGPDAR